MNHNKKAWYVARVIFAILTQALILFLLAYRRYVLYDMNVDYRDDGNHNYSDLYSGNWAGGTFSDIVFYLAFSVVVAINLFFNGFLHKKVSTQKINCKLPSKKLFIAIIMLGFLNGVTIIYAELSYFYAEWPFIISLILLPYAFILFDYQKIRKSTSLFN